MQHLVRNISFAVIATIAAITPSGCASSTGGAPVDRGRDSTLTAEVVVRLLAQHGILVPNPLETTLQECPSAGCQQSFVTDTLRVKSFATERQAARYAKVHGANRERNVVVTFAPPLSRSDRYRYWKAIEKIL